MYAITRAYVMRLCLLCLLEESDGNGGGDASSSSSPSNKLPSGLQTRGSFSTNSPSILVQIKYKYRFVPHERRFCQKAGSSENSH